MNIFASSVSTKESAQALDDKRLIKMILESAQMLSTNLNLNGIKGPYKTTHQNHPCAIWTRTSHANYFWLFGHFMFLCEEYTYRFGKIHKCEQYQTVFINNSTKLNYATTERTPFPNCTTFKHIEDTTQAYRLYLNEKWKNDKRAPKWTNRQPPDWYLPIALSA